LISLFPQPALSFGVLSQHPMFQMFFTDVFDAQKALLMLSFDALFYLALYFYLDEVFFFSIEFLLIFLKFQDFSQ